MSKLSCGGLRVVMTVGLGVLACSHAHGTGTKGGDVTTTPVRDDGGPHGERDPVATPKSPEDGATAETTKTDPARIGPIRRAAPFVFVPHPDTATLARLTKTLRTTTVGPSAELRVEIGCPDGARIVDRSKSAKLPIGKDEARSAVVDPSAQWLAVELANDRVAVFSRAQQRLGTWDGRQPIAVASDLLVMRHDCRWVGVDPGKPDPKPEILAEDLCGDVVHVDAAARRISVAQTMADTAGVKAIVQLVDGSDPVRFELPTDPPLSAPAVSPDGKILCGIVSGPGKPTLQCRPLEGGAFERVAQGVVGPLRFASDAPRLAFAVALGTGNDAMDLHVADFEQRFVRKLGRVHQHRFAFLPGGERLVAYEGGRGIVFDLASGHLVPFGDREDDWAAVVPLPATQDEFLATRVKKRCNDLVKVTLPKD